MDKTVTGLLGAAAALTLSSAGADATPTQPSVMNATSYADLLEPIQNASDVLVADDAARAVQIPGLELVQYNGYGYRHHHHHHHHHNAYYRRYYRPYVRPNYHHHHHHHHNAYGYRYNRGY